MIMKNNKYVKQPWLLGSYKKLDTHSDFSCSPKVETFQANRRSRFFVRKKEFLIVIKYQILKVTVDHNILKSTHTD